MTREQANCKKHLSLLGALLLWGCSPASVDNAATGPGKQVSVDSQQQAFENAVPFGTVGRHFDSEELGATGQDCYWDGSCDPGYVCLGVCQPQSRQVGAYAGPCGAQQSCDAGLECREGICADPQEMADVFSAWVLSAAEDDREDEARLLERQQGLDPLDFVQGFFLPEKADIYDYLPPAGNQGRQGSCLTWAAGYGLRSYQEARERRFRSTSSAYLMSPSYLFNQQHNTVETCNQGTTYEQIFGLLKDKGIAPMSLMPYAATSTGCTLPIPASAHEEAAKRTIRSYEVLFNRNRADAEIDGMRELMEEADLKKIKVALARHKPVVISVVTFNEFMSHGPGQVMEAPLTSRMPSAGMPLEHGRHAILAVAYDDTTEQLTVLNSWSARWGTHGMGKVSYAAAKRMIYRAATAKDGDTESAGGFFNRPTPEGRGSSCQNETYLLECENNAVVQRCDGEVLSREQCADGSVCLTNLTGLPSCMSPEQIAPYCQDEFEISCSSGGNLMVCDAHNASTRVSERCPAGESCQQTAAGARCVADPTTPPSCDPATSRWMCDAEQVVELCAAERRVVHGTCKSGERCAEASDGSWATCLDEEELCEPQRRCDEDASAILSVCGESTIARQECGAGKGCVVEDGRAYCIEGMTPQPSSTEILEIRVSWGGRTDLDLFVTTPNGKTISYSSLSEPETGGTYKPDNQCSPRRGCDGSGSYDERVVWREEDEATPTSGNYGIQVSKVEGDAPHDVRVEVRQYGNLVQSKVIEIPAENNKKSSVYTFTYSGD